MTEEDNKKNKNMADNIKNKEKNASDKKKQNDVI